MSSTLIIYVVDFSGARESAYVKNGVKRYKEEAKEYKNMRHMTMIFLISKSAKNQIFYTLDVFFSFAMKIL